MSARPSRRDLLKAGVIGAGALSGEALIRSILDAMPARAAAPATLDDIEHVVIFIQENRSFDHYFGRYPGVRGFDDRSVRLAPHDDGTAIFHQATTPGQGLPPYVLPYHLATDTGLAVRPGVCTSDIEHQWRIEHAIWHGGRADHWVVAHTDTSLDTFGPAVGVSTMGYYDRSDLPFYYALADAFTICDGYYCSTIGGTDLNRIVSMSGTMDPDGFDGGAQFLDTQLTKRTANFGAQGGWLTYPEQLQSKGISWKVYSESPDAVFDNVLTYWTKYQDPTSPLFQNALLPTFGDLLADVLTGALPQVSWIIASDVLNSEHAPEPINFGEAATQRVLQILTANPAIWAKTVVFLTYDENGGFFDHVPPPVPPPRTPGEFLPDGRTTAAVSTSTQNGLYVDPVGLGWRVPMLVISPFSRGGFISSDTFDHTSLLRFLERRFGAEIPGHDAARKRPGLTQWRRETVGDLTSAINFAAPDTSTPSSITLTGTPVLTPAEVTKVATQCIATGTPLSAAGEAVLNPLVQPYPPPAVQSLPRQEPLRSPVRRPSGPVAGTAPAPSATGSAPGAAGGTRPGLPDTGGLGVPSAAEILSGAGILAAAWWARRRRIVAGEAPETPT